MTERKEPGSGDQPVDADEIDLRDAHDRSEEVAEIPDRSASGGPDVPAPSTNGEHLVADEVLPAEERDQAAGPVPTSWASRAVSAVGGQPSSRPRIPEPAPDARMEPLAVAALVLGIAGVLFLPLIFGGLAIFLALRARRKIVAAEGALRGGTLARIGLVLGWIGIALWILLLLGNLSTLLSE